MKRTEWLIVTLPLLLTWAVDRLTKMWAEELSGHISYGWLHFYLHHNHGAMLGLFSDLPPILRIVSLSTGGAFLVCTYVLIQYLLPIKSLRLRCGMSILLGGILGNVTDRVLYGYVTDFILIGNESWLSPAFNPADALQWIGYGLIVVALFRENEILWPKHNARKTYWVNRKFQMKYSLILLTAGLGISLVGLVFSYTYLRVTILQLVGQNETVLDRFLIPFAITFSLVCIGVAVALFTVGKILSHQIAGPIYAFEKFIDEMIAAKTGVHGLRKFKLRSKDEFKNLEDLALRIRAIIEESNPPALPSQVVEGEPPVAPVIALKAASGDGTTDRS